MTLRVKKVLHHEKSKYQDVLIFESTDYGRVLVLDNVIQATERDEFSYQEMITHLAMNSHPNPKKVLVIGGGDGGVLREVVKHDCVEEAILCDIDEVRPSLVPRLFNPGCPANSTFSQAVIRLSKEYLPSMSVGFDHPKSKVHVGDGFKFLDDYKNAFDVIITDSSDPEGPAESLFQKPYFQLLHDALREGGVITTQGCTSPYVRKPLCSSRSGRCLVVRGALAKTPACLRSFLTVAQSSLPCPLTSVAFISSCFKGILILLEYLRSVWFPLQPSHSPLLRSFALKQPLPYVCSLPTQHKFTYPP